MFMYLYYIVLSFCLYDKHIDCKETCFPYISKEATALFVKLLYYVQPFLSHNYGSGDDPARLGKYTCITKEQ